MNRTQLIILLLVLFGPGLAQVYQKIKEKRQIDRINRQRQQMKNESLRTGRVVQGEVAPAKSAQQIGREKMAALEQDRRSRLAALRDQARQRAIAKQAHVQQQRQSAAPARQVSAQMRPAQSLAAQVGRSPQRVTQRKQRGQRQPSRVAKQQTAVRAPRSVTPARPTDRLSDSQRRHRKEEAEQRQRLARERAEAARVRVTGAHVASWLRVPSSLKRAIVMQEVLGPPVSLR